MRYIIVDEEQGVFLGAHQKYMIFAKNDIYGMTKAYSFDTLEEAQEYVAKILKLSKNKFNSKVIEIDVKARYVKIEDLIRRGYGKYTHNLMDNIPMLSTAVH